MSEGPQDEQSEAGSGGAEKRKQARYEVTAYVDYTGSEVLLYHRIENLSLGGICIQSTEVEDVGSIVDLVINIPELSTSVAVRGEVVWANREDPMDMGIRYLDLDENRRGILREYLQKMRKSNG